jgi:hypothetical protein
MRQEGAQEQVRQAQGEVELPHELQSVLTVRAKIETCCLGE